MSFINEYESNSLNVKGSETDLYKGVTFHINPK